MDREKLGETETVLTQVMISLCSSVGFILRSLLKCVDQVFPFVLKSFYQIKIILGKNSKIKAYNQTHDADKQKAFIDRKRW